MKSKRLILIVIMIAVIVILPASQGHSLLKPTHAAINESISDRNINDFSLSKYLINQLGFKEGTKEPLRIGSDERTISNWISYGGIKEDEPEGIPRQIVGRARNQNHFHNPLEPWDQAGLHVVPCAWRSSIVWAQNPDQSPGGKWSWYDAREYFYQGLTFTDKKQRDSAMANCFRALGQLMHLVQDASVPAHVRGDVHILYMCEN